MLPTWSGDHVSLIPLLIICYMIIIVIIKSECSMYRLVHPIVLPTWSGDHVSLISLLIILSFTSLHHSMDTKRVVGREILSASLILVASLLGRSTDWKNPLSSPLKATTVVPLYFVIIFIMFSDPLLLGESTRKS